MSFLFTFRKLFPFPKLLLRFSKTFEEKLFLLWLSVEVAVSIICIPVLFRSDASVHQIIFSRRSSLLCNLCGWSPENLFLGVLLLFDSNALTVFCWDEIRFSTTEHKLFNFKSVTVEIDGVWSYNSSNCFSFLCLGSRKRFVKSRDVEPKTSALQLLAETSNEKFFLHVVPNFLTVFACRVGNSY